MPKESCRLTIFLFFRVAVKDLAEKLTPYRFHGLTGAVRYTGDRSMTDSDGDLRKGVK